MFFNNYFIYGLINLMFLIDNQNFRLLIIIIVIIMYVMERSKFRVEQNLTIEHKLLRIDN